ncbi:MAG: DUF1836 domain-containing protein [Oscillospiraceae bacterium]|nr:DUF1836 domain-containing protein [Oscillospiraceae bacterium]
MDQNSKAALAASIEQFHLPAYENIPNVGLYLEQTTRFIADYLAPLENITITGSMISNYVKRGLIRNPVKKQYDREQIAYLFFIAVAKSVLSLENVQVLITLQRNNYDSKTAYDYFSQEFQSILQHVFGLRDTLNEVTARNPEVKTMLRNTIITVAHKVYLEKCFSILQSHKKSEDA